MKEEMSDRFVLDVTGANGTPFRFVALPAENALRYYDRRYTLAEGEPGYGINHTCEDGQACGPALRIRDVVEIAALRGWHDESAWDVDVDTMRLVHTWMRLVQGRFGQAKEGRKLIMTERKLITLPREPWRGGQICGWRLECDVVRGRLVFCGEFKKHGSPLCDEHDKEMREKNYGTLPRFAPGNALGLAAYHQEAMPYLFQLSWEPADTSDDPHGENPIPATGEEIAAWEESKR